MITLIHGNAFNIPLADKTVQCCITSPPYWGLRDYGIDGQLGLESTPEEYVEKLVAVFREVWRVMRDDGVLFLNMGDTYNSSPGNQQSNNVGARGSKAMGRIKRQIDGLKPKDLCGIPWRVAFALQADGWYLRSDIIWAKPNPMPESVRDRPTKSHEYLFLLSKSEKYYYDAEAIREGNQVYFRKAGGYKNHHLQMIDDYSSNKGKGGFADSDVMTVGHNRRTVWTIPTEPYKGAHFATFPPALVEPCILAGTSKKGCCSICGKPWERAMEKTSSTMNIRVRDAKKGILQKKSGFDESATEDEIVNYGKEELGETKTLGWQPTCTHDAPPVPCTVLDPFAGTATVGVVAAKHSRNFVGIELKSEYIELAKKRIAGTQIYLSIT